ncbi:MAG: ATP-grasp domain-containing protein [Acidimicrobiales bacterium]
MAVLVLHSPRGGKLRYHGWLADLDDEIYLLCSAEHLPAPEGYAQVLAFEDYEVNGALEAAAWDLFDRCGYRAVIAGAECDILRAARLRDLLGLDGQSEASAVAYRDKSVMKSFTARAGIATPKFRRLHSTLDLVAFGRQHGYPVVVKPLDGSGAVGFQVIEGPGDAVGFARRGLPRGFEVEQLVDGHPCHVDGLVLDGEVVVSQPSRYIPAAGCLAAKQDEPYGSYFLDPAGTPGRQLDELARQVLAALPSPRHFTFHLEAFHTPAGELVFCEVASRTGGCAIAETLTLGLGVDLDRPSVRAQCGLGTDPAGLRAAVAAARLPAGRIVIPPRRGTLVSMPEDPPSWVCEYRRRVAPGTTFDEAAYRGRKSGDFVASFVVTGSSETEVARRLWDAAAWFGAGARWAPP